MEKNTDNKKEISSGSRFKAIIVGNNNSNLPSHVIIFENDNNSRSGDVEDMVMNYCATKIEVIKSSTASAKLVKVLTEPDINFFIESDHGSKNQKKKQRYQNKRTKNKHKRQQKVMNKR